MDDQKQSKFTIVFMPDDTPETDTPEFAALRDEMVREFEVLLGLVDEDE